MKKIAILAGIIDVLLAGLLVLALLVNPAKEGSSGESGETALAEDFVSNAEIYDSAVSVNNYESDVSVSYKASVDSSTDTSSSGSSSASSGSSSTSGSSSSGSSGSSSGSSSSGSSSGTVSNPYAGFVFPDSNTVLLTSSRISSTLTDPDTCRRSINEIYARHGYLFQKQENLDYFNTYSWYKNMTKISDMTTVARQFNSVEKANVEALQAYETSKGWG